MLSLKKKKTGNSKIFRLAVNKYVYALGTAGAIAFGVLYFYPRHVIPTERVGEASRLVMLADLDDDGVWSDGDGQLLDRLIAAPWDHQDFVLARIDVNRNQQIDSEDVLILKELYATSNPYRLFAGHQDSVAAAPKAREFFRYQPEDEFVQRPAYGLDHGLMHNSPVAFLAGMREAEFNSPYRSRLAIEIYDEALRFSFVHARREDRLSREEKEFVESQLSAVRELYGSGDYYAVLLRLILLSEAGETLSTSRQPEFVKNVRFLAQEFRDYLVSERYSAFSAGDISWQDVFADLDAISVSTTGVDISLATLEEARNLGEIRNYVDRAEWQVYKSKTRNADFHRLVNFAQNDRRYLRAVSNTSERHADKTLENHNLPMMLLFSQAMAITDNDKKAAVGLLDESIRIPFFWVKSIPDELRPTSVALEHFLLPGNMEDGSDKSRHWNVFGGLAIYRTPEESLMLAFQREVEDVRAADFAVDAMTEFIRDMIANFYGIYHVVSYEPR